MCKKIMPFLVILLLIVVVGCSNQSEQRRSSYALFTMVNPAPIEINSRAAAPSIGDQVREDVNEIDEIYDAAIIEGKKGILVAYKVKHLYRFQMKKIEKNIKKTLKKKYPKEKIYVSSDYKIFLEVIRLGEKLDHHKISQADAEKRFNEIIKLKKEMT
ncbi:YhcN/YlaJ family sporulation lipoprotein [Bacillus sp. FJAT-50079]|uniref:YhcN/YlaJ family sporulation lipoprotein n=1 Tax=Bacillus sp. FJAT-50079 TaxID=2833577 RepID=UPI001BC97CF8|nr:YhcN/YlaJ family sporulation lipoprotein [Bacillus sp. FJAT-50079]MBS4207942.1 YhcN/YlaJ family sporulation lipoprotein [Bacillus sp. FJAT-50079]